MIHKHNRNNDNSSKTSIQLLKIQVENQCYCMTIMQVGVVACLGVKNTPGRCAVKPPKESPERVLSRRGLIRGKGKMVIFVSSKHS